MTPEHKLKKLYPKTCKFLQDNQIKYSVEETARRYKVHVDGSNVSIVLARTPSDVRCDYNALGVVRRLLRSCT
jgi:hypothetical protein